MTTNAPLLPLTEFGRRVARGDRTSRGDGRGRTGDPPPGRARSRLRSPMAARQSLSHRLYRWFLRLFPSEFRGDFGDDMSRRCSATSGTRRRRAGAWRGPAVGADPARLRERRVARARADLVRDPLRRPPHVETPADDGGRDRHDRARRRRQHRDVHGGEGRAAGVPFKDPERVVASCSRRHEARRQDSPGRSFEPGAAARSVRFVPRYPTLSPF